MINGKAEQTRGSMKTPHLIPLGQTLGPTIHRFIIGGVRVVMLELLV